MEWVGVGCKVLNNIDRKKTKRQWIARQNGQSAKSQNKACYENKGLMECARGKKCKVTLHFDVMEKGIAPK